MNSDTKRRGSSIDWQMVRTRLQQIETTAEEMLNPSPDRAREIMDARARALAQVPASSRSRGSHLDVILFGLGRERYAIETCFVREVVRLTDFTPVPGTPDLIVGVTNLRGAVVAVVDLGRFFNVPRKGLTDLSRVIVLGTEKVEFGVLADEAYGQMDLAPEDILTSPDEVSGAGRASLRGVTREAIIIVDGAALLADERLFINQN
jgi:purine-binding chemotaxis protein CheW